MEIAVPVRGEKRSLVDLAGQNAKQSYDQRFRVLQPSQKAIREALQDVLMLPELPRRIECFDISHIQGAETVASMVVWEDGAMKKSDYRKFQIKTVEGVDDFASMREVIGRRYRRLVEEKRPMPSLILVDGGLGQLHAAAEALEELGLTTQPLASIAKREEIIYLYGQENEPVVLERRSPVLHLIQHVTRRVAPLRDCLSSQAAGDARPGFGTADDSGCGRADTDTAAGAFRQPAQRAAGGPGGADGGGSSENGGAIYAHFHVGGG